MGSSTRGSGTYLVAVLAVVLAHVAVDYGAVPHQERPPGVAVRTVRTLVLTGRVLVARYQVLVQSEMEKKIRF